MASDFIRALPKAELHLHLEGSIAPTTLIELSQRYDAQPLDLDGVTRLYSYSDFAGFLNAFKEVSNRLRTPEDYELITYRLIERLAEQGVIHAEVTCSVGVCLWRNMEFEPIFEGMERGRARGQRDFGVSLLWIFDAIRQFGAEPAERVLDLALKFRERNVIAFGIGGDEQKGPPELFRETYRRAKDGGLHLTAHAGETTGPESIWGAINIGAERLGHVLSAWHDPDLIELLAHRQIPIEVCPTSNLRTGAWTELERHPMKAYFDRGLMVTLNSDDPAMFGSTLNDEYELAQREFGFTDEHLRELARNSFEASFLPADRKVEFLNLLDSHAAPR